MPPFSKDIIVRVGHFKLNFLVRQYLARKHFYGSADSNMDLSIERVAFHFETVKTQCVLYISVCKLTM